MRTNDSSSFLRTDELLVSYVLFSLRSYSLLVFHITCYSLHSRARPVSSLPLVRGSAGGVGKPGDFDSSTFAVRVQLPARHLDGWRPHHRRSKGSGTTKSDCAGCSPVGVHCCIARKHFLLLCAANHSVQGLVAQGRHDDVMSTT